MRPELNIDPRSIIEPQSSLERIKSFFSQVPDELVARVLAIDVEFASFGESLDTTLRAAGDYIEKEADFYRRHYPSGFRYKKSLKKDIDQALKMEELWIEQEYRILIKMFIDLAIDQWEIADRVDQRFAEMSEEEIRLVREAARKNREANAQEARKAKEIPGYRPEFGYPPELLELDGARYRNESMVFLLFAVALARKDQQL